MTYEEYYQLHKDENSTCKHFSDEHIRLKWLSGKVKSKVTKNTPLTERESLLRDTLEADGFSVSNYFDLKPHTGAAFNVVPMSDHYRVNFRCGYGKHNYAPVLFIQKSQPVSEDISIGDLNT